MILEHSVIQANMQALQKATAENNERERKLEFELQRVIDEKSQGMLTHQAALEEKRIQ